MPQFSDVDEWHKELLFPRYKQLVMPKRSSVSFSFQIMCAEGSILSIQQIDGLV